MLKKLSFLVSWPFMAGLMIVMIVVLAVATFVESAYSTQTAWAVVYGTRWFEVLFLLVAINLVGVLIKQKLFQRRKLVVVIFHLAFILIIVGAAITRFISYEGIMHIREQTSSSSMISDEAYIDVALEVEGEKVNKSKEVALTALTPKAYKMSTHVGGEKVKIRSVDYISSAMEQYVSAPGGEPYLRIAMVTDRQSSAGILAGTTRDVLGMRIGFNLPDSSAMINFFYRDDKLTMLTPFAVTIMQMGAGSGMEYEAGSEVPIESGKLYAMGHIRLALEELIPSTRKEIVEAPSGHMGSHLSAVKMELEYRGMRSEVFVPGRARIVGESIHGHMGDLHYTIAYGSRELTLPFALFLKDFQVERYPGSNSPSSFASEVVLLDKEMGIQEDRRIYMNNVLKHRGYRFYQSSYDNDEMGTVLSVNSDRVGTFVTYLGYLLLIAGMLAALAAKGTRFTAILRKTSAAGKILVLGLLLGGFSLASYAQDVPPKDVSREFGKLWVQDRGGRFEPMNTLSEQVVRKVSGHSHVGSYTADQVMLGMLIYPELWQHRPMFEIKHPELQRITGYKGNVLSFRDMMDSLGHYLLSDLVNEAYAKQVVDQSQLDKEIIKLDDKLNAFYMVQKGSMQRIFPDAADENHTWASIDDVMQGAYGPKGDSLARIVMGYLSSLQENDYESAGSYLGEISDFQKTEELLPTEAKKNLETFYNKSRVFPKLAKFYALFGLILMVLSFLLDFNPNKLYRYLFRIGVIHLVVAFAVHTLALVGRWYISGHAPMSNGYESMIFMSWVTLLAGLIFVKRSRYAMGLTAILSALSLLVAGMSNMNPEITNLVPVLKSPWLTIHVAVIMAGYGFLGLASIMGLLNMSLYASLTTGNKSRLNEIIAQVSRVNHLTLIVGLYFMTAGVFLGGVWANESWGRYWGWDPKETWALITVLVYAFVTHMHRIPGLKGRFAFNTASFFSYASVLMTYFGVNYFLGGIHSYASGTSFKVPIWSYVLVVALIVLAVYAYRRQQKLLPGSSTEDL